MVISWEHCKITCQKNSMVEISVVCEKKILIMNSLGWPAWVSFEKDRLFKILINNEIDYSGNYYVPINQPVDGNFNNMDLFEVYVRIVEAKPMEIWDYMPPDVFYVILQIAMIRVERRIQRLNNFFFGYADLPLTSLFKE